MSRSSNSGPQFDVFRQMTPFLVMACVERSTNSRDAQDRVAQEFDGGVIVFEAP